MSQTDKGAAGETCGREIKKELFAQRLTRMIAERSETTYSVAEAMSLTAGTISRYANGLIAPKITTAYALAAYLHVDPLWLMGYDESQYARVQTAPHLRPENILPAGGHKVPLLGTIAAGVPIYAEEQYECYMDCAKDADFCLRVKGDSMTGARILDGDIVFIHRQPDVEDGQIAAVMIDDEATLKRVYKVAGRVILRAENPAYPPMEFSAGGGREVVILGKAIIFQGAVR